jgi:hypothetical protein
MLDAEIESQFYMTPFAIEQVIYSIVCSEIVKVIDFHEGKGSN